ncbi:MAG: hypothetical protein QOK71_10180, partial [Nitrososphaeraceae archaeon]|nr:hypothetical protein [Nitrososphaeraceae archaeon]
VLIYIRIFTEVVYSELESISKAPGVGLEPSSIKQMWVLLSNIKIFIKIMIYHFIVNESLINLNKLNYTST